MPLFTPSRKQILRQKSNDINNLSLLKSCNISAGEKRIRHVLHGRAA